MAVRFAIVIAFLFFVSVQPVVAYAPGRIDSTGSKQPVTGTYIKFYPMLALVNRWNFAVMRVTKSKSIGYELGIKGIFPFKQAYDVLFLDMLEEPEFLNGGIELIFGINKIRPRILHKGFKSFGVYLSYRYEEVRNKWFWNGGLSGGDSYYWERISQSSHRAGIYCKWAILFNKNHWMFEAALTAGFHLHWRRTAFFEKKEGGNYPPGYQFGGISNEGPLFIPMTGISIAFMRNVK